MIRVDEQGYPVTFEARNLVENQKYDFWVTASTSTGEGEPTSLVTQSTNTRAPARIASFSQTVKVPVGTSLTLECLGELLMILDNIICPNVENVFFLLTFSCR